MVLFKIFNERGEILLHFGEKYNAYSLERFIAVGCMLSQNKISF